MNFNELTTVSDWTQALQQIAALATNAVQQNDQNELDKVQNLLIDFQHESPPSFNSLDAIAFKMSQELNKQNRTTILNNLGELAKQLTDLSKLLGVATEHALLKADAIQLKNTKDFLSKAKASLQILVELRDDLKDNTTNFGKKVEAVFVAINNFEEAFK